MRKLLLLMLLCSSTLVLAQESRKTTGSPFSLPISVDINGKVTLFGQNKTNEFAMSPAVMGGIEKKTFLYSFPEILTEFRLNPIDHTNGFFSVRKLRIEAGLGRSTLIQSVAAVGLVPYKGALHTLTQFKENHDSPKSSIKIPKTFAHMSDWSVGDHGTYETYGGVVAYFSLSSGIVEILKSSIGIQNEFEIQITKTSENSIRARFIEGNLKRRQLKIGPTVGTFSNTKFNHESLRAEFTFNLDNPAHEILYRKAMKGRFEQVVDGLDVSLQKLSWHGTERELFYGIPMIAGHTSAKAHFEVDDGDASYNIDYKRAQNNGILTALRLHQRIVFQSEESIALIWVSQMQNTHRSALQKNFLRIGKILGVDGFDRALNKNSSFGTLHTQIAIDFSKEDYAAFQGANLEAIKDVFKNKCLIEKLACQSETRANNILNKFKKIIAVDWEASKDKVGSFLIEEPALISTLISFFKLDKELYFKFLSEKFQSVEGKVVIRL